MSYLDGAVNHGAQKLLLTSFKSVLVKVEGGI